MKRQPGVTIRDNRWHGYEFRTFVLTRDTLARNSIPQASRLHIEKSFGIPLKFKDFPS